MASEQENTEISTDEVVTEAQTEAPEAERKKSDTSMVALAIRAVCGTLVAIVLAFGCFLSFSPYYAMRIFDKLELKDMALSSAERYLSRNAKKYSQSNQPEAFGKYADALYYAVNASIDFMNDSVPKYGYDSAKAKYYAERVDKYVGEYSGYNVVTSLQPRTQRVDEYAVAHTQPSVHPYVCDYADSIRISRFKAWYILGKDKEMSERVQQGLPWVPGADSPQLSTAQIDDLYLILGQLSVYIDCELDNLELTAVIRRSPNGFITPEDIKDDTLLAPKDKPFDRFIEDDGQFTAWYNLLVEHFDEIVDAVRNNALRYTVGFGEENPTEHLKYTRYMKILDDFGKSMINMTALLNSQWKYFADKHQESVRGSFGTWYNKALVVPAGGVRIYDRDAGGYKTFSEGSIVSLSDWYNNGLLYDYLGFWRSGV